MISGANIRRDHLFTRRRHPLLMIAESRAVALTPRRRFRLIIGQTQDRQKIEMPSVYSYIPNDGFGTILEAAALLNRCIEKQSLRCTITRERATKKQKQNEQVLRGGWSPPRGARAASVRAFSMHISPHYEERWLFQCYNKKRGRFLAFL